MNVKFTPSTLSLLPALVLLSSQQAFSQTWDGGGGSSDDWGTADNWNPNTVPTSGANVTFASAFTSGTTISLGTGTRTIGNLIIGNVTNFSLSNGTLALNNVTRSAASGTTTIDSAVTLRQDTAWSIATGGTLLVNGLVTDTDSESYSFTKTGGGTLHLAGTAGFDGDLTVSAGRLILSGNNNTGEDLESAISVANGAILEIRHANALGTTGAGTTVVGGGALEIRGGITTAAEALTLSGGGISNGGALRNVDGSNTWTGPITVAASTRINSDSGTSLLITGAVGESGTANKILTVGGAGNTTISGVISGPNQDLGIAKDGSGTLTLSGANTYTGTTTVSAGTLVINGNQNSAGGNISVTGSGTRLQGSGTTGADMTTIGSGAILSSGLKFNNAAGGTTSDLTFNSGSIFEWNIDAAGSFSQTTVEGNVTKSGATAVIFRILLTDFTGSFWNSDHTWTLADIFGDDSTTLSSIFGGGLTTNANAVNGGRGFSYSGGNLVWAAIPEPTSALAGVLLGAGLLRRRRRAAA